MMKKLSAKLAVILSFIMVLALCMTACSGSDNKESGSGSSATAASGSSAEAEPAPAAFTGDKYVSDDSELSASNLPENYVPVPYDTFVVGYKFLVDEATTSSTYDEIAALFGDDGIRMDGIEYGDYSYYIWYSDKQYAGDTNIYVLVTFKAKDNTLTYFAYSSIGILPEDVR